MKCTEPKVTKFATCTGGEEVKAATEGFFREAKAAIEDGSILQPEKGVTMINNALRQLPNGLQLVAQFDKGIAEARKMAEAAKQKNA